MTRGIRVTCLSFALMLSVAAAPGWNAGPWLEDLAQVRAAVDRDYPNLDWLTGEREISLDRWFSRTADDIRQSHNDAEARDAMQRLIERFNDGHVVLNWPIGAQDNSEATPPTPATTASFCAAQGYDARQASAGTAASLPGYEAIDTGGPIPAGLVNSGAKVGVVRLGAFSAQAYPFLCAQAVASTRTPIDKACDDACSDRLLTEAYAGLTRSLIKAVDMLRIAGAQVLLIDLTRNGGGTEWAEAAARIVSPVPLRSASVRVIRADVWVARWSTLATKLRHEARRASSADRKQLLDYAKLAEENAEQLRPCLEKSCSRLARSGFATGLVAELPSGIFDGKPWGPDIFSPAQYPYHDSVWRGAVIVLVDSETWSAAEQFAALLQDNGAAVIMGTRTGGAGCGHLYGNDPIILSNSKARLELPNCARVRKDGSNEVSGIVPDVPTGARWNDGPAYAGQLTAMHLPTAIARAQTLRNGP